MKILLEAPGVNINDNTHDLPIVRASFNCHSDIVQFLIDNGADVNAKGYKGNCALTAALLNVNYMFLCGNNEQHTKYADIAKLLIKYGANTQGHEYYITKYLNTVPENIIQENISSEGLTTQNDQQKNQLLMPGTLTTDISNEIGQPKESAVAVEEELAKFIGEL